MPVTNQYSDQLQMTVDDPSTLLDTSEVGGRQRIAFFDFTQSGAGDANSTAILAKLPAGRLRILREASVISSSAFGASRTLDVGYQAFTAKDGTETAADADALVDGVSVANAATNAMDAAAGADPTLFVNSRTGVTIEATVLGGTIPDGATLKGYIAYIKD